MFLPKISCSPLELSRDQLPLCKQDSYNNHYQIHNILSLHSAASIDLDSYQFKKSARLPKMWLADYDLTESDKEILLSPTAWLTDTIVDAAQTLLRQQFPALPGLQSVSQGMTMSYDIQEGEFVQVINTSHGQWLTISTIGLKHPQVQVFDSLYSSIPIMAKAQIASLLCTEDNKIDVSIMDVQLQVYKREFSYNTLNYVLLLIYFTVWHL